VATSSDTLAWLLIDQVLTTGLAGSLEDNLLLVPGIIGNDGGVLLVGLDDGSPPLTASDELFLGPLRGVAGALSTSGVFAISAFVAGGKVGVALVTGSADTHANWLVHTEDGVVTCGCGVPFRRAELETESLREVAGTLLK
jgi:hypothetical protein